MYCERLALSDSLILWLIDALAELEALTDSDLERDALSDAFALSDNDWLRDSEV